ncbi:MAG: valine--tRNA ligase [Bacilli bacterium]|nr:valine--tRNA ligase [Bacilli bacterium]
MLETKYNHIEVEKDKYETWKNKGYFNSGDLSKKPFCIVIPPPNVTGKLHLGHAWDTTLQDIIIRYKRMDGYDALWLPGMDHAGIATQAKVDKKLKELGYTPRMMDREEWLNHAWNWKKEYADNIREQWAKLGLSLDYSKERFTLDKGLNDAVNYVFINLYNKGLIYQGERIINWDPEAMTALSNEEVIYKEVEGAFYHIKYFIENTDNYLEVATTRPETLFGDTAVAVNPKDDRYKDLIGKNVILPILNKLIPIIADEHADPEFGTGVVKITPAHDPNDFEVGNRHNLERIKVINTDGTMNEFAGIYKGMDRFECRNKLVEDLKTKDLLIKIEKLIHSVGHSERTDVMVEPYLSKQWFVKMESLAKHVLENQQTENKVKFVPEKFEKILTHWMEDCHDWCISRQLWWGHRIPAWYKGDEVKVQVDSPGSEWMQDNDVLDTWFSSALWPFSTLGFPNNTEDLKRYFPTDVLVTGYDIIFFWVARMIFQSLEFMNNIPFKECIIHGLIRDKEGRKMSKSLGNGVDPMEVIEKYGCDSLRYFISTSTSAGTDLRYDEEKIKATWNFINKLWNASRFVLMNIEDIKVESINKDNLNIADRWILNKLDNTIEEVRRNMDKYEFNNVGTSLYSFIWNDFCDWYIELSKLDMNNTSKNVLLLVLTDILKMLHPFMPYVTEEIYQMLPNKEDSIVMSAYPQIHQFDFDKNELNNMEELISFIKNVRKLKKDNNIGKEYCLKTNNPLIEENKDLVCKILKTTINNDNDLSSLPIGFMNDTIYVCYDNTNDNEQEKELLLKEKETLEQSITRRTNLLNNSNYTSKAPANIVENDRLQLEKEKQDLNIVMEKLKKN